MAKGGMHGERGCMAKGGMHGKRGACMGYDEIWKYDQ